MLKKINSLNFQVKRVLWLLTHHGYQVTCPFCGSNLTEFMSSDKTIFGFLNPKKSNKTRNYLCPRCKSTHRERHVFLFLKKKKMFNHSSKKTVLHVAPEPNLRKVFSANPNLKYISSDLVPKKTKAVVRMDITKIDLDDNCFDVILCNHVLEHIPEDQKAMKELSRVLKHDGWAIIQVPLDQSKEHSIEDPSITKPSERLRVFGHEDHVRIYGQDYVTRLEKAGFTVEVDRSISENRELVKKFGLIEDEPIFLCRKQQ